MMKKYFSLLLTILSFASLKAQYPRQPLMEHFTNTVCSICASRNPGFYQTLSGYPQVIHVAFHPSSPYQNCLFSQQNKPENDARTNYYGIYGSTPRFVLNGKTLPSVNPAINTTTLDTVINQTSPVQVEVTEELIAVDSVNVKIVIRVGGTLPVSTALLFAGVAEDPVLYNAPNGESVHYDVFRKALSNVAGTTIQLPQAGDSITYQMVYKVENGWNVSQLHTTAWVQRADTKEILNADESSRISSPLAVGDLEEESFSVYPNPFSESFVVSGFSLNTNATLEVRDITGRLVERKLLTTQNLQLNTYTWQKGVYFLRVGDAVKRVVKQ